MEKEYQSLANLNPFIKYLEDTKEEEWAVDVVRTKNGANCMFGHLVNWFYGKDYKDNIMPIWDAFESMWATSYMVYPVNDGQAPKWMNEKYEQKTPKGRVVAYLKNLRDKKEKNTDDLWKESEVSSAPSVT